MGVHSYHDGLPGFSEAQILHDGCDECERRGKDVSTALASMDRGRFAAAWKRAADWNTTTDVRDVSQAERDLLHVLWSIQIKLETICGLPIGGLPRGDLL
jgi:hypothetical protein